MRIVIVTGYSFECDFSEKTPRGQVHEKISITTEHRGNGIQSQMRHRLTPVRMALLAKPRSGECWCGREATGTLTLCSGKRKTVPPPWKTAWKLPPKRQSRTATRPSHSLSGYLSNVLKSGPQRDTSPPVLISTVDTVANAW